MDSNKYRIDLQYLGKPFNGWQSQADESGVQDHLERALQVLVGEPCRVIGASRTDSGVHAKHQVAIFTSPRKLDLDKTLAGLMALLPVSIGISSIDRCSEDFHPIANAKAKAYCYRFWRSRSRDPFLEPYVHRISRRVDVDAMATALQVFIGRHDFNAFCATDSSAKTRVRSILAVELIDHHALLEMWILGEGFLKQMVRIIAGTVLEVGQGKRSVDDVRRLLEGRAREEAGVTLPGKGLSLERVYFDELPPMNAWIP